MTEKYADLTPVSDIEEHSKRYVSAFNTGDPAVVDRFYADDAVTVWEPGEPLTGEARRAKLTEFLAARPSMVAVVRESHVTGDTALLVTDWNIDISGPDGEHEHLGGAGLDVLVRDPDGTWRFAIDNPYGDNR